MPEDVQCPICGSETVERTAKKGPNIGSSFHVCNRYPECKGKVAIGEQMNAERSSRRLIREARKTPEKSTAEPKFIQKERKGNSTYEIYKGTNTESARAFLLTKRIDKKMYYIVVETPEGNWGVDVQGLYLEHLLSWQTKISSAKCEGNIIPMSWSQFGLNMAARGATDNFIAEAQCGDCEHRWLDGIRYQNKTVVRCPNCRTLNKVDSINIQVMFV